MAKYKYELDEELHFPSLNLVVKKGDVFEAAEDLTWVYGIVVVDGKKASKDVDPEPSESSEA
jgi:hypothetical protein